MSQCIWCTTSALTFVLSARFSWGAISFYVGICIYLFYCLQGAWFYFFPFLVFHHALNSICCSLGFALLVCSFSSLHCIFTIICVVHLLSRALLSSSGLLFRWIAALLRLQLACFTLLLCVSLYGLEGLLLAFSCFFFMCLWCIFFFLFDWLQET